MHIINKYHDDLSYKPTYKDVSPHVTVPDQSYTVKELLERFTSGLLTPMSVWHEDVGDDFSDLDNPNPLDRPDVDLTDKEAVRSYGAEAKVALASLEDGRQRRRRETGVKSDEPQAKSDERKDES